jgi:hypothetical protein
VSSRCPPPWVSKLPSSVTAIVLYFSNDSDRMSFLFFASSSICEKAEHYEDCLIVFAQFAKRRAIVISLPANKIQDAGLFRKQNRKAGCLTQSISSSLSKRNKPGSLDLTRETKKLPEPCPLSLRAYSPDLVHILKSKPPPTSYGLSSRRFE